MAITEFGCCTYRGADDRGARGMEIVENDRSTGTPDGDPRDDLDLASPGIVKVLEGRSGVTYPGLQWEPKAAFRTLSEYYGRLC